MRQGKEACPSAGAERTGGHIVCPMHGGRSVGAGEAVSPLVGVNVPSRAEPRRAADGVQRPLVPHVRARLSANVRLPKNEYLSVANVGALQSNTIA